MDFSSIPPILFTILKKMTVSGGLVALDSETSVHRYAVYLAAQGRRPGRKRDFSGFYRVGGLMVPQETPPAAGLVFFFPEGDEGALEQVCRQLSAGTAGDHIFSPWPPEKINQVLVSDGTRWRAMVRGEHGAWTLREAFEAPDATWMLAEALRGTAPGEPVGSVFSEQLRRALLPWPGGKSDDGAWTAVWLASHAREAALSVPVHEASMLDRFVEVMGDTLGWSFAADDAKRAAAYYLCAAAFLQRLGDRLAESTGVRLSVDYPSGWMPDFVEPVVAMPDARDDTVNPFAVATARLRGGKAHEIRAFIKAFWCEVMADSHAADSWNPLPAVLLETYAERCAQSFSAEIRRHGSVRLFDPHAGVGDVLVAALRVGPNLPVKAVYALEADPVKFQMLRLQLIGCLTEAKSRMGVIPKVRLELTDPLGHPGAGPAPSPDPWWVVTDLRAFDPRELQRRPHPEITRDYADRLRDEWKRQAFDPDNPFYQYCARLLPWIHDAHEAVGLFFTPQGWLEDDNGISVREAWLNLFSRLDVDLLPLSLATTVAARKAGVAAVLAQRNPASPSSLRKQCVVAGRDLSDHEVPGDENIFFPEMKSVAASPLNPTRENRFALRPTRTTAGYSAWPSLLELVNEKPLTGPMERRGLALIREDRNALIEDMQAYFDPLVSDAEMARRCPAMMTNGPRFDARHTRRRLRGQLEYREDRLISYDFRPFDRRWAYLDDLRPLLKEPAPQLQRLARIPGNLFLVIPEPADRTPSGPAVWLTPYPCDYDFYEGHARHFPLYISGNESGSRTTSNLSAATRRYLEALRPAVHAPAEAEKTTPPPMDLWLWHYALAVLFTPTYIGQNADAIRRDWPRIPLPGWKKSAPFDYAHSTLKIFEDAGQRIAAWMHTTVRPPKATPTLSSVALLPDEFLNASSVDQRRLADSWGLRSKTGAVRLGKEQARLRERTTAETNEIVALLDAYEIEPTRTNQRQIFGAKTLDVMLSNDVYWRNVPAPAWTFKLGGHPVLRKWLSYRTGTHLNRALMHEECDVFTDLTRRLLHLAMERLLLDRHWPALLQEVQ